MSAGLDSLGSVEFANVLSQKLGLQMPGTLVFDYPSVSAVTGYLTAQMLKSAAAAPMSGEPGGKGDWQGGELATLEEEAGAAAVPWSASDRAPRQRHLAMLAIIAHPLMAESLASDKVTATLCVCMRGWCRTGATLHSQPPSLLTQPTCGLRGTSCHLPSQHPCMCLLPCTLLQPGLPAADCIHRVPLERWDLDHAEQLLGDALTLSAQFGAFMRDVELFDSAAHGLSAAEATAMDPQHRLVPAAALACPTQMAAVPIQLKQDR